MRSIPSRFRLRLPRALFEKAVAAAALEKVDVGAFIRQLVRDDLQAAARRPCRTPKTARKPGGGK